jgi:leader peptidase (prepilin peptidase)/N-methyltransferase
VSEQLAAFAYVCLGAFGLLFGSFANVLIWRIPRGESIVSPGSHCPKCEHDIRWYDNIPVVSWLVLRAKCRDCGEPIAWRYPAVELASGVVWVLAAFRFDQAVGWVPDLSWRTPLAVAFFYLLLVLSVIDLDHRRLPTPLVMALAGAAVAATLAAQLSGLPFAPLTGVSGSGLLASPLVLSGLGFLLGAGTSWGIAAIYGALRGRQGLGFGDVRLLGAMGIVLGPYVLLAYALANVLGVVVAIPALMVARGRSKTDTDTPLRQASFPFGPFLAMGGLLTALAGPTMWGAYLQFLRV